MFTQRTLWGRRLNRIASAVHQMRKSGEPIVDLTETNPTRCGLGPDADSMLRLFSGSSLVSYDPDPQGLPEARLAISERYARKGIRIGKESILLTTGTSEAYSFLFRLLCESEDEVLVPRPSYPLLDFLGQLNDISLQPYSLLYDGEWSVDLDSLERRMNRRTRAVVLVHPNNPTGSFVKKEEREAIGEIVSEHDCALIVDEVFGSFSLREDERRSQSFAAYDGCLTFALNGISKMLGMPQGKLGWIAVSGPAELREDAIERLAVITDTFLSVGTAIQHGLPSLFLEEERLAGPIRSRVKSNLEHLKQLLPESASSNVLNCEGGWTGIVRVPAVKSDEEWVLELLAKHRVLVHPGHFFDVEEGCLLVVSLLTEPELFQRGIRALRSVVEG